MKPHIILYLVIFGSVAKLSSTVQVPITLTSQTATISNISSITQIDVNAVVNVTTTISGSALIFDLGPTTISNVNLITSVTVVPTLVTTVDVTPSTQTVTQVVSATQTVTSTVEQTNFLSIGPITTKTNMLIVPVPPIYTTTTKTRTYTQTVKLPPARVIVATTITKKTPTIKYVEYVRPITFITKTKEIYSLSSYSMHFEPICCPYNQM